MGKGTKLYRFVCNTGIAELQQKYHPECTETHHIETRNQNFF